MNKLMMIVVGAALSLGVSGAYAADAAKKDSSKAGASASSSAAGGSSASDASKDAAPKKGRAARKAKG